MQFVKSKTPSTIIYGYCKSITIYWNTATIHDNTAQHA